MVAVAPEGPPVTRLAWSPTHWNESIVPVSAETLPPSFIATDTGSFRLPLAIRRAGVACDVQQAIEDRRRHEMRAVIRDAILTGLGLRRRRLPRTPEQRLEMARNNIRSDFENRGAQR